MFLIFSDLIFPSSVFKSANSSSVNGVPPISVTSLPYAWAAFHCSSVYVESLVVVVPLTFAILPSKTMSSSWFLNTSAFSPSAVSLSPVNWATIAFAALSAAMFAIFVRFAAKCVVWSSLPASAQIELNFVTKFSIVPASLKIFLRASYSAPLSTEPAAL